MLDGEDSNDYPFKLLLQERKEDDDNTASTTSGACTNRSGCQTS